MESEVRAIAINYGIKTGFNDAFIVDNLTKEALVTEDPRSAEILKPVVRGRDIRRYRAHWAGLWLIATFPAAKVDIDDYPAVKRHLLTFGRERLEQSGERLPDGTKARKKTSNAWYEMQDTCAYHADFAKEKLLWMNITPEGRFAYSGKELFCNNAGFIMTGSALKYLCAVLNSNLATWFMRFIVRTTGVGELAWEKFAIERLPIPKGSVEEQHSLIRLVDRVLAESTDPTLDNSDFQAAIEAEVNALYGLTAEEVRAFSAVGFLKKRFSEG